MELYAKNMTFLGKNEREQAHDYCVHGEVVFKIGDVILSDETQWCVSASAFRFLHTLFDNHFVGGDQFLIPCCGHMMIPSEDETSVNIYGCDNGIDFNIVHTGERILITTQENEEYAVSFEEYKTAVLTYAKQVMDFYTSHPPREFENDFDKAGYRAFVTEWYTLYDKAIALADVPTIPPITFEDYDICTEHEIMGISQDGISLKSFRYVNFNECAYNYKQLEGGAGTCVGERDIEEYSFTFYTSPKPLVIQFVEKSKLAEFIKKKNTATRFHNLQKQLEEYGYTTKDRT